MNEVEFIIYVSNQAKSKEFYEKLLQIKPCLNVSGMTEFKLAENVKLGLMTENGIARIISNKLPHPKTGTGIPRCELYLKINNPHRYVDKGHKKGNVVITV